MGKSVDKLLGNEREVIGKSTNGAGSYLHNEVVNDGRSREAIANSMNMKNHTLTKGNSPWEGWGTALKPALEPITVARKPLSEKTVAKNVLKWGTGGINIDGCRVEGTKRHPGNYVAKNSQIEVRSLGKYNDSDRSKFDATKGRFPANLILDEEAGRVLDEQSGVSKSQGGKNPINVKSKFGQVSNKDQIPFSYGDKGGASRFFKQIKLDSEIKLGSESTRFFYQAKASKKERNMGCEGLEEKNNMRVNAPRANEDEKHANKIANHHPTIKPIALMEYLINLVSTKNAVILDPFAGSFSTGIACINLDRGFKGIEMSEEYCEIGKARMKEAKRLKDIEDEKLTLNFDKC